MNLAVVSPVRSVAKTLTNLRLISVVFHDFFFFNLAGIYLGFGNRPKDLPVASSVKHSATDYGNTPPSAAHLTEVAGLVLLGNGTQCNCSGR